MKRQPSTDNNLDGFSAAGKDDELRVPVVERCSRVRHAHGRLRQASSVVVFVLVFVLAFVLAPFPAAFLTAATAAAGQGKYGS